MRCRNCGLPLHQHTEKALSGEVQVVLADATDEWVCSFTGNEHEPGEVRHPIQVVVKRGTDETMIWLTESEFDRFVAHPMLATLDDSEVAWDLQDKDPERRASLTAWANGLFSLNRD